MAGLSTHDGKCYDQFASISTACPTARILGEAIMLDATCSICSEPAMRYKVSIEVYKHYECLNCGHIAVLPKLSEAELSDFYSNEFIYVKEVSSAFEGNKREKRHNYIQKHFGADIVNCRGLDIGCANGDFLLGLKEIGIKDLSGIEPNEALAHNAVTHGFNVIVGMFGPESYKSQFFDVINLGDVIEHVSDPDQLLLNIREIMSEKAILTMSTPNIDNPFSKLTFYYWRFFRIPWSSLDPPAHVNLFTRKSLEILCNNVGLETIAVWTYSTPLLYELGHTHLFRKFRERKNPWTLFRWISGWSIYVVAFYLNKLSSIITKNNGEMVFVVRKNPISFPS